MSIRCGPTLIVNKAQKKTITERNISSPANTIPRIPKICPFLYGFLQVAVPAIEKANPIPGDKIDRKISGGIRKLKKNINEAANPMMQNTL